MSSPSATSYANASMVANYVYPFIAGGLSAIVVVYGLRAAGVSQAIGDIGTIGVSAGAGAVVASSTNLMKIFGNY